MTVEVGNETLTMSRHHVLLLLAAHAVLLVEAPYEQMVWLVGPVACDTLVRWCML